MIVNPCEAGRISKHQVRLTAESRNHPSVKRCENSRVSDTRPVRRKGRAHLVQAIMCTLNGLTVGQQLDVDLAPAQKRVRTPNKCTLPAILRHPRCPHATTQL